MYTVLVASPGIGKGDSILPVMSLLEEANTAHILSDNLTMQYVLERLSTGFPVQGMNGTGNIQVGKESASILIAEEFSTMVHNPDYDLPNLNALWNSREGKYPYGTRTKGIFEVSNPCQSLLAGSAPEYLTLCVPQSAVGGGFTRRVTFVYARGPGKRKAWPSVNRNTKSNLVDDIRAITSGIHGEYLFDTAAKPLFERIFSDSGGNDFDDEATTNYKTSKWVHAAKLAIVLAASRDDRRVILKEDIEKAGEQIDKVIDDIARVFRAVGDSDMAQAADRVMRFIEIRGAATEDQILYANHKHVSINDLAIILGTLKQARILEEKHIGNKVLYQIKQRPKGAPTP